MDYSLSLPKPIHKYNMRRRTIPQIYKANPHEARFGTSPNPLTKIDMTTNQHYKLRFLLTFLKIVHVFSCISFTDATLTSSANTNHFCSMYTLPSTYMPSTRLQTLSTRDSAADPTRKLGKTASCNRPPPQNGLPQVRTPHIMPPDVPVPD